MIPRLYSAQETAFTTLGLGVLSDCQKCTVTEARNGEYRLEMDYPITGAHYQEIKNDTIILAKPNDKHQDQPFRVTQISKPIGGIVSILAEHLSYKTSDIIIEPFSAGNAAQAVAGMKTNSVGYNPFVFTTDKSTAAQFRVSLPRSYRELMGGTRGSLLDVYGGEYEYDRFTIFLRNGRGNDNGVVIEYGKNLTDLKQDESIANLITAVYPYWSNNESVLVTLPEKTISTDNPMSVFPRIQTLDLSGEFEEAPTVAELRAAAQSYIDSTDLNTPSVSITASFEYLWQMDEYAEDPLYQQIAALEKVNLCDTITVRFPGLGVDATAKIVSVVYNVLLEKYDKVNIGSARTNLLTQIASQQEAIESAVDYSELQKAIDNATNAITGATGGYVVLDPPKNPQQILIMDTDNKATASRVWRWNLNGLGYSSTGVNGPFRLAMTTSPGAIVADFITAGTLNAALAKVINLDANNINTGTLSANFIKAGVMTSENSVTTINLNNGTLRFVMTDGSYLYLDSSGLRVNRGGVDLAYITAWYASSLARNIAVVAASDMRVLDANGNIKVNLAVSPTVGGVVNTDSCNLTFLNSMRVSWVSDGSGGFTLKGSMS